MTEAQIARTALDCQDACNLSGVVHSWAACCSALVGLNLGGTDALNTHPACILFASKVASLTGYCYLGDRDVYSRAYDACAELAAKEE